MTPVELHQHIQQLLDGDISTENFAALEAELLANSEALASYHAYILLHCGLECAGRRRAALRLGPVVPIDRVAAFERRRLVKLSLAAAAAMLFISMIFLWTILAPDPASTAATYRTAPESVFSVAHINENPSRHELTPGSRLDLHHGAVELDLPHQVRAIIEAPARLTLIDERTLALDHGRAFFEVPTAAGRGFTVVTPHQRIVDLGTAFGIDLPPGRGEVDLHVFSGHVRIDSLDGRSIGESITAPRSVRLSGPNIASALDPTEFRQQLPGSVETLLLEDFEAGLLPDRRYSVRIDSTAIRGFDGKRFPGIRDDTTWQFSTAPQPMVPIRVASYTYDGPNPPSDRPSNYQSGNQPPDSFTDPDNSKLINGNPGHPDGWITGTYVGFLDHEDLSNPQVTFDLGSIQQVDTITLSLLRTRYSQTPESVNVSTSLDGDRYSAPINLTPAFSGTDLVTGTLDLTEWGAARYYRLNFVNPHQWLFLGEVEFAAMQQAPSRVLPSAALDAIADPENRGDSPPQIVSLHPENGATSAWPTGQLAIVFDQPVRFGTGRVIVQDLTRGIDHELVVGGPNTRIWDHVLTIRPPHHLSDGERVMLQPPGWESDHWLRLINPSGDGKWYAREAFHDRARSRGVVDAMRGPVMASLGVAHSAGGIRHNIGPIAEDHRYTVSIAVGVRDAAARDTAEFLGYTLRLISGEVVLAEHTDAAPPGLPNSVTEVGFSWDASDLPAGTAAGDPLAIEIATLPPASNGPGYLDIDHVRVTRVEP